MFESAQRLSLLSLVAAISMVAPVTQAQDEAEAPPLDINWQHGPTKGRLGGLAEVDVPEGYVFLNRPDTIKLLEAMENPASGSELGTLAAADDSGWMLFFSFDEIGYVDDEDQDDLDADALLESIKEGTRLANEERVSRGWAPMQIDGWRHEPAYNAETNNLEWAIHGSSEGYPVLNHDIRLLGRSGVMEAGVVVSPEEYDMAMGQVRTLLGGFRFSDGNRYGDYTAGDKVADYGLAALITGGGAAVALKTGLFKKLWKVIVGVVVVIAAGLRKLFGGRRAAEGPQDEDG